MKQPIFVFLLTLYSSLHISVCQQQQQQQQQQQLRRGAGDFSSSSADGIMYGDDVPEIITLNNNDRSLSTLDNAPYYTKSNFPGHNWVGSLLNPMKGFYAEPTFTNPSKYDGSIGGTLELYKLGLDVVMLDDPFKYPDGQEQEAYGNWTKIDEILEAVHSRGRHAIFHFFIFWPKWYVRLPLFLIEGDPATGRDPVKMKLVVNYGVEGMCPYFNDPVLEKYIYRFVRDFARRYDGDKRILGMHQALLGYWGESHAGSETDLMGNDGPGLADKLSVVFAENFKKTKIMVRYASRHAYEMGLGFRDSSFCFSTIDGEYNRDPETLEPKYEGYFTWPKIVQANATEFYKNSMFGGEFRPGIDPFTDFYQANTRNNNDFFDAARITHTTYMIGHKGYVSDDNILNDYHLEQIKRGAAYMGYAFIVTKAAVARSASGDGKVDLEVTIQQKGVAPFYYDLSVRLDCADGTSHKVDGVENIQEMNEEGSFVFKGLTTACLTKMVLDLDSSYEREEFYPIKWATWSSVVQFEMPGPNDETPEPQTTPPDGGSTGGLPPPPVGCNAIVNSDMSQGYQGFWETESRFGRVSDADGENDGAIAIRRSIMSPSLVYVSNDANFDYSCFVPGASYQVSASVKLQSMFGRGAGCASNAGCPIVSVIVHDGTGARIAGNENASLNDDSSYSESSWEDNNFNKITSVITLPRTGWDGTVGSVEIKVEGFGFMRTMILDEFSIVPIS